MNIIQYYDKFCDMSVKFLSKLFTVLPKGAKVIRPRKALAHIVIWKYESVYSIRIVETKISYFAILFLIS